MSAVIYYDNKLINATVTSEQTVAGFPFANCFDGRTSTQAGFSGTSVNIAEVVSGGTVDYVGFAKHNIATTGANILIETAPTAAFTSAVTVFDGAPALDSVTIEPISVVTIDAFIRVTVTGGTGDTFVSDISIGQSLPLERGMPMGYMPPKFAYNDTVINSVSQSADLCGSVRIPKPKTAKIEIRLTNELWFDTNWPGFIDHLPRPFYFIWDDVSRSEDAAFIWIKKKYPQVRFGQGNFQTATIDGEGIT